MSRMRLAVVIVNYRTPQLVEDCLASLQPELETGRDVVVVVDNDSGDDSVTRIQRAITPFATRNPAAPTSAP